MNAPNTIECDDGQACTKGDVCGGKVCAGTGYWCDDDNVCTSDQCVGDGSCVYSPIVGGPMLCDDNNACTENDACSVGVCGGSTTDCDDGNLCTTDSCDVQSGCVNAPNTIECDDGQACTKGDVCSGKVCAGTGYSCDDDNVCTSDQCVGDGSCDHSPVVAPTLCNDNDACTQNDACSAGECAGAAFVCNDDLACTEDSCDGDGGCDFVVAAGHCVLGGACFGDGQPNPENQCEVCDAATPNAWTTALDGTPCDDGLTCTGGDTCQAGACSAPVTCSANGLCSDCQTCTCSPGFGGEGCATECPGGQHTPCSLHGQCGSDAACACDAGYVGLACETRCSVESLPGAADQDGDGVCDFDDACPADALDDVDNDGVCDGEDVCADGHDGADADADNIPDACDDCPSGDCGAAVSSATLCDSGTLDTTCVVTGTKTLSSARSTVVGTGALTIASGAKLECPTALCTIEITLGGALTVQGSLVAGSVVAMVDSAAVSGIIDTTGRGYGSATGPGAGKHCSGYGAAGAAAGGDGEACEKGEQGADTAGFGEAATPFDFGSGGGKQQQWNVPGGAGGGRIKLIAQGAVSLSGTLRAAGGAGQNGNRGGGGGAGGSIVVNAAQLTGTGTVDVSGGSGGLNYGGGGGGGRIALYGTVSESINKETRGGCSATSNGCASSYGGAGTVWEDATGTLTISTSKSSAATRLPGKVPAHLSVSGKARVLVPRAVIATDTVFVGPAARLSGVPGLAELRVETGGLVVQGALDAQARLTVIGQGHLEVGAAGVLQCTDPLCTTSLSFVGTASVSGVVSGSTVTSASATLQLAGTVDTLGRGHAAKMGAGAGQHCGGYGAGGGGHGGLGGHCEKGEQGTGGGASYGSPALPFALGSGGGTQAQWNAQGGRGGGRIRILARGPMLVTGTLDAGGEAGKNGNRGGGGGSGGSITVHATSITGTGAAYARGGNGGLNYGGGGAGGRIALYSDTAPTLVTSARGGCHGSSSGCDTGHGAPGTVYDGGACRLTVDSQGTAGGETPLPDLAPAHIELKSKAILRVSGTALASQTISIGPDALMIGQAGQALAVSAPNVTVEGALRSDGDLSVSGSGILTVAALAQVECTGEQCAVNAAMDAAIDLAGTLNAATAQLESAAITVAGTLNADGRGHPAGQGPGAGKHCAGLAASGGGHGGRGLGCEAGGQGVGAGYGSHLMPFHYGSGGGTQAQYNAPGGKGGGRVALTASGTVTITGLVSARGTAGQPGNRGGGGGSGGSIRVHANALNGDGELNADGGHGGANFASGGGGGRIALYYATGDSNMADFARGGCLASTAGCASQYSAAGSVYDHKKGRLSYDNHGRVAAIESPLTHEPADRLVIRGGALVEAQAAVEAADQVWVESDGTLRGKPGLTPMSVVAKQVRVDGALASRGPGTADLTVTGSEDTVVAATGTVKCAGKACEVELLGGALTHAGLVLASTVQVDMQTATLSGSITTDGLGFSANEGPGKGQSCSGFGAAGGGYGGEGGGCQQGTQPNGGAAYGSFREPFELGSGGAKQVEYNGAGGLGGGRIRVETANALNITGQLTARGTAGGNGNRGGGGGAGGSIWLTSDALWGDGTLDVRGGNGGQNYGGGGGGGRIALDYQSGAPGLVLMSRGGCHATTSGCSAGYAGAGSQYNKAASKVVFDNGGHPGNHTPFTGEPVDDVEVKSGAVLRLNADTELGGHLQIAADGTVKANALLPDLLVSAAWVAVAGRLDAQANLKVDTSAGLTVTGVVECTQASCTVELTSGTTASLAGTVKASTLLAKAAALVVDGLMDLDGRGHAKDSGPGKGKHCSGYGASGAGHGGDGVHCEAGEQSGGGATYGAALLPFDFGSGGGTNTQYASPGGAGGGRARLEGTTSLSVDGTVTARGLAGGSNNRGGGGGAGGSIQLVSPVLEGAGVVDVRGGDAGLNFAGGGAGGRVALLSAAPEHTLAIAARGGCSTSTSGCKSPYGGAGSVYDASQQTLSYDAQGKAATRSELKSSMGAHLVAKSGATLHAADSYTSAGSITIDATSQLIMTPQSTALVTTGTFNLSGQASATGNLSIDASNDITLTATAAMTCAGALCEVTLSAGNALTVSGQVTAPSIDLSGGSAEITGTLQSDGLGHPKDAGAGKGAKCSNKGSAGAGHGGQGAGCDGADSVGGSTYGSATQPTEYGSGGGSNTTYNASGGPGGGRIKVVSTGTLDLSGLLSARGQAGGTGNRGAGGGSGGSIWLDCTTLTGTGTLDARGGNGGVNFGGGGGGGRIALHYDAQPTGALTQTAKGGCNASTSGCKTTNAQGGTLHNAKTQTTTQGD